MEVLDIPSPFLFLNPRNESISSCLLPPLFSMRRSSIASISFFDVDVIDGCQILLRHDPNDQISSTLCFSRYESKPFSGLVIRSRKVVTFYDYPGLLISIPNHLSLGYHPLLLKIIGYLGEIACLF